jgi:hypothetical protein
MLRSGSPVAVHETARSETSTVSATPHRRSANRSRPDVKPVPSHANAGQQTLGNKIELLRNDVSEQETAPDHMEVIPDCGLGPN